MRTLQAGILLLAFIVAPSARAAETQPFGTPAPADVEKATKLVRQTFAEEYQHATTLPARAELARRLLREALDTRDDGVARYALLCEARDLATRGADATTACRAIDLLAEQYGVAAADMALAALMAVGRFALTPESQESLVLSAIAAADRALARDEYDLASRLAKLAEGTANKAKRVGLMTDAQEKYKEIVWAAAEHAKAKAALDALKHKPDDAAAKSAAGRFRCLVKNDWDRGLPLLLECADAALKELAERDHAALTADATAQAGVADAWWTLGEQHLGRARLACRSRAAYWYRLAAPKLSGLPRTLAEKRLDELDALRLRDQRLAAGVYAEIFSDTQFQTFVDHRIDPTPDGEWPATGDRAGVPNDDFAIRWSGKLRAPASGKYTFLLLVNEGARIFIDDRLVLEEVKGSQKRKPTQATVTLSEGMHPLRIEYWDTGGAAKFHLTWQPPGAKDDAPIPAKAFVHETAPR